jgi:hypothetical protein
MLLALIGRNKAQFHVLKCLSGIDLLPGDCRTTLHAASYIRRESEYKEGV